MGHSEPPALPPVWLMEEEKKHLKNCKNKERDESEKRRKDNRQWEEREVVVRSVRWRSGDKRLGQRRRKAPFYPAGNRKIN